MAAFILVNGSMSCNEPGEDEICKAIIAAHIAESAVATRIRAKQLLAAAE